MYACMRAYVRACVQSGMVIVFDGKQRETESESETETERSESVKCLKLTLFQTRFSQNCYYCGNPSTFSNLRPHEETLIVLLLLGIWLRCATGLEMTSVSTRCYALFICPSVVKIRPSVSMFCRPLVITVFRDHDNTQMMPHHEQTLPDVILKSYRYSSD